MAARARGLVDRLQSLQHLPCRVAGRWWLDPPARRPLSRGAALPDPRALYRDLLRAVRAFPPEPMLDLSDGGTEQSFAVLASIQIRSEFNSNKGADPVTAGKLIAAGQKELKALQALLSNEHLNRYPGPPRIERLHQQTD